LKKPGVRTSTASAPRSAARAVAAGADDERPASRDRLARRRDRAIAFVVVQECRFPVRAEHHEAGQRPGREPFVGARQPLEVQAIVGVERRRQRCEHT
jgi:hypothetical protein